MVRYFIFFREAEKKFNACLAYRRQFSFFDTGANTFIEMKTVDWKLQTKTFSIT